MKGAAALTVRLEALLDDPRAAELAALFARLDSGDFARRGEVVGRLLDSTDIEALVRRSGAVGDLIDRLDTAPPSPVQRVRRRTAEQHCARRRKIQYLVEADAWQWPTCARLRL